MIHRKFLLLPLIMILSVSANMHREILNLIETKPTKDMFKLWHFALNRPYDLNSEVALQKYKVFKANSKFIQETNDQKLGYELGLGPFSDITWEEFKESYLHEKDLPKINADTEVQALKERTVSFDELADKDDGDDDNRHYEEKDVKGESDWRYLYDDVRDQGSCGSCWAFSAIGSVEGFAKIKGYTVDISEQELVDCDDSSYGCEGGFEDRGFNYLKTYGVASESDYRYEAGKSSKFNPYKKNCRRSSKPRKLYVISSNQCGYSYPRCTDSDSEKFSGLAPYTACMEVKHGLEHYKQGDWVHPYCTQPNHAVVVVGYNGVRYIVRNSWGRWWGINGYGYVNRNHPGSIRGCGLGEYMIQATTIQVK